MGKLKLKQYPAHVKSRGGCKVSWLYFSNEEDAKKASEAAHYNGKILFNEGYDFGFRTPGEMHQCIGGPYDGLWEVTIP